MEKLEDNEENLKDFNVYYLNFSKVYEIAMMIDNQVVKSVQKEKSNGLEDTYMVDASLSLKGNKHFLNSVKASMGSNSSEKIISNAKVVESIEVQTTKSILLRRIIGFCKKTLSVTNLSEGDLIKVDNVKMRLLDEEALRQFLLLKRDALKGLRVEGMDVNNIINSMLQDYAYIMVGKLENNEEIIVKIPMEAQAEFENKYNIDDLLMGHVSVVGIYKREVQSDTITSNTLSFFQDKGEEKNGVIPSRIIKSGHEEVAKKSNKKNIERMYPFVDTLAIIQDVNFVKIQTKQIHWWNKFGMWLSRIGR